MAKYYIPFHNLSVFNPAEFPTTDPNPANVKGLTIITSQVATNGATVDENTTLINNYCKLYTTTLPTSTFKGDITQYIAYSGGTVPNGVPFTLIFNLNIGTISNLIFINTINVQITNAGFVNPIVATWTQPSPTDAQTKMSNQFVFTGRGNGVAFNISFTVSGTASPQKQFTLNTANTTQGYVNDLMMFWL